MNVKILSPLYGGMGLAKEEMIYFVKGAIPDETVEVQVLEKKKDYTLAEAVRVLEPSPFRQVPPCPVFGICGGCHYQYIGYERQLSMKQEIICDCLRRIGKFQEIPFEEDLSGNPFRYRKRAQFKISAGRIGFYRENSHDIVEFDKCLLLDDSLNEVYGKLKQLSWPAEFREITLTSGNGIIAAIPRIDGRHSFLKKLADDNFFNGISTADGQIFGEEFTEFEINGIRYTVSAGSFLQSNWELNRQLSELLKYSLMPEKVSNATGPDGNKRKSGNLLDVFGGAGNFSLPLRDFFDQIIVIEENASSVMDGKRNAEINAIGNALFLQSSSEDFKVRGKFETVIVDPPRIGLTDKFVKKLMQIAPERFFYISCNPATFARDAAKLKEMYRLDSVRLVDMFPQTYHCEIFSRFTLK